MQDTRQIIFEVGEEYGLTREQSLDLWNQYWNEYVLRSMHKMENLSVILMGLGTFFLKKRKLETKVDVLNKFEDRLTDAQRAELARNIRLIQGLEERNSKFKRKRIYG